MARFPLVRDPSGSPEVERLYGEINEAGFGADGVPIHWFTSQATRPDILASTWALAKGLLAEGRLPPTLKQLITMTISAQSSCRYCTAAHSSALQGLGIDKDVIERAAKDPTLSEFPPAYRAAVAFSLKAARDPRSVTDADRDALRDAGWSDGEIMEVVMLVAYTHFTNTWADVSGIPVDGAE